eukprot:RCo023716
MKKLAARSLVFGLLGLSTTLATGARSSFAVCASEGVSDFSVEHRLSSGHLLRVRRGDITKETTKAIVNPANGHLAHGGGAARAIAVAAGNALVKEGNEYVSRFGVLPTGKACITTGGNLVAEKVIHAVGPVWSDGHSGEKELLREAMMSALELARQHKLESIAVPAISSGIYGFPKPLCAEILVRTTVDFCLAHPTETPRVIHFTNFDEPSVALFEQEVRALAV